MNNKNITKTQKKMSNLKLEVIRFNSADVIATSGVMPVMFTASQYEFIPNFTIARNYTAPNTTNFVYSEPTSGQ